MTDPSNCECEQPTIRDDGSDAPACDVCLAAFLEVPLEAGAEFDCSEDEARPLLESGAAVEVEKS